MKKQKKKNIKFALCGCFGGKDKLAGGQGAKTINLYNSISLLYSCLKIDTYNFKKRFLIVFLKTLIGFFKCDIFCVCLSRKGTKKVLKLLFFLRKIIHKPIFYFPVGICPLPVDYKIGDVIDSNALHMASLIKKCDSILVETNALKNEFENTLQLNNVKIFKNYKMECKPIKNSSYKYKCGDTLHVVYFSRITEGKNPFALIDAVRRLNKEGFRVKVDFYGSLNDGCREDFLKNVDNETIFYKGYLKNNKEFVLSKYDCMVFTTTYLEGTPGSIIDAYFAGIPVLSQSFLASDELVKDPKCGDVCDDVYILLKNSLTKKDYLNDYQKNVYDFACSYYSSNEINYIKQVLNIYGH